MVARRKPTRARRGRNRVKTSRSVNQALVARAPGIQRTGRAPRMRRIAQARTMSRLSEAGVSFLKCAFASPDFSVDPGKGIPDSFHGRTLGIKDCNTTSLSFTPNTDTYIVIAPVPGYAYFRAEVPIGSDPTAFIGSVFPTFTTNFGSGADSSNNFSKFRYASLAVGLYPTSNMMQFSGSIQVWRVDLNLAETIAAGVIAPPTSYGVVSKRIQGLQGVVSLAPRDNFSTSFINGAYTFAFDKTQDFEWQDFCSGTAFTTAHSGGTITGIKHLEYNGTQFLTGLGNVNTIVIKVSTPTAAVNTAILRVWNCLELQPDTQSALFQYSGVSPPHDPLALELYHNLKMQFPVAMPSGENAKFWETVLRAIAQASKIGMLLPGPIGTISGGVNTVANALHGLVL